jgi:hypothetical protein
MPPEKELREKLAEYAHNAWAGWMRYLFSKSEFLEDGSVLIPPDLVLRWLRQTVTSYDDLPEHERDSDLAEADVILRLLPREE